jgi:hypothetical protein
VLNGTVISNQLGKCGKNRYWPRMEPETYEIRNRYPDLSICQLRRLCTYYCLAFINIVIICNGLTGSRDSVVGIATDYGLDDRGVGVHTGSGAHPTYPMGTGGSFPGGKASGA